MDLVESLHGKFVAFQEVPQRVKGAVGPHSAQQISNSDPKGPYDGSCEDIEVDENLPFLENFVQSALARGAAPYVTLEQRIAEEAAANIHTPAADDRGSLRFEAYETPVALTLDEQEIGEAQVLDYSASVDPEPEVPMQEEKPRLKFKQNTYDNSKCKRTVCLSS